MITSSLEITVDAGEGWSIELAELGMVPCSEHRHILRNGNSGEVTRFEHAGGLAVRAGENGQRTRLSGEPVGELLLHPGWLQSWWG